MGVQQPAFVEKIVPFYVQCLLEVSPAALLIFRESLRKYDIHRTRQMESSPLHSFASHIARLPAAQAGMHRRWASSACRLSFPL
jgi:hypothetical protein